MHGTIMLLLYATPIVFGFANIVLPLQIGAPDVAFPRLNALAFWLFVFGAAIVLAGFITPGGAADFGWTAYAPLSNAIHSPGAGGDLWIMGLIVFARKVWRPRCDDPAASAATCRSTRSAAVPVGPGRMEDIGDTATHRPR